MRWVWPHRWPLWSEQDATAGVLIKNAEALERLEAVDTIVVDKTGTLTEGKPKMTSIVTLDGGSEDDALRVAAGLEQGSEHPLAAAIVAAARDRGLAPPRAADFHAEPGKGIQGTVNGARAALGNLAMMRNAGIAADAVSAKADDLRRDGQTVMYLAVNGRVAALLGVADPIKATTPEAITALHQEGWRIVMVTGDNRTTAEAVAKRLHLDEVRAEVLPAQKREIIQELQRGSGSCDGRRRRERRPGSS